LSTPIFGFFRNFSTRPAAKQKILQAVQEIRKQCRKLGGESVKGAGLEAPFTFNNPPAGDGSCRKQNCFLHDLMGLLHFAAAPAVVLKT